MKIVPIASLGRAPEQGRIRYGVKAKNAQGKMIPRSITKFRFTSHDKLALGELATLYGGQVVNWEKGQMELISTADEIPIILPPGSLSQSYEMWAGQTCIRRCDGVTAQVPKQTPEGAELVDTPCICMSEDNTQCKVTTRLQVIIPNVRFAGIWRLDCKGWYGSNELPSMVSTIEQLQARGHVRAYLALEERAGKGKKWITPVLRLGSSVDALLTSTGELGVADIRALGTGDLEL